MRNMGFMSSHLRPREAEHVFPAAPLEKMSFRARWVLGFKVLIAAQLVWLPITLCLGIRDGMGERTPLVLMIVLLLAVFIFGPLWAAGLFRAWVSNSMLQRILEEASTLPSTDRKACGGDIGARS